MDKLSLKLLRRIGRKKRIPIRKLLSRINTTPQELDISLKHLIDQKYVSVSFSNSGLFQGLRSQFAVYSITAEGWMFLSGLPDKVADRWITRICAIGGFILSIISLLLR